MKTELIIVGKTDNKHISACIDDYVDRISHYMPFSITTLPDIKNTKNLSEEQQKEQEGKALMRLLQPSDFVVLLDERGKEMRSIELAEWIRKKQMAVKRLVFIIGGPYGFSPTLYQRCDDKLSLSRLTFSHQMVRMIFAEQIYRACTIIKGEPYHHE